MTKGEEYCSRMNRRTRHDSSGSTFATPYEAYDRYQPQAAAGIKSPTGRNRPERNVNRRLVSESSPNCLVSFPLPFVSRREAVGLRRRYEWGKRMKIRVEELGDRRSILGTLVLRSYPSCDRSSLSVVPCH